MEFKFKYIDEEQLNKVIKKVQRKRRFKQEASHYVQKSLKESLVNVPIEEEYSACEEKCQDTENDNTSVENSANKEYLTCSSGKSCLPSVSLRQEVNEKLRKSVSNLNSDLRKVRRNILTSLDELIVHNEVIQRDKDPNEKLDESVVAKARNYLCLIIRLEYPFIVKMRQLSLRTYRQNMVSQLKVLFDCHNIAWKIFKIFIRGAPHVLKLDKSKEKLNSLLERVLALSSYYKLFSNEQNDIVGSEDFLMDDVDRKCIFLRTLEKKLVPKHYENKQLQNMERVCMHCRVSTRTNDGVLDREMHIPMVKFKKLAERVFGGNEKPDETVRLKKSHRKVDSCIHTKKSKDEVNASERTGRKEYNMLVDKGVGDSPDELEHQTPAVNTLQLCEGSSLRETMTASESNYDNAKGVGNMIENVMEDKMPNSHEKGEITQSNVGKQNHLPENVTKNNHSKNAVTQTCEFEHSDEDSMNKQDISCSSMNVSHPQELSPSKGDVKLTEETIKMYSTAGSISDQVLTECLQLVGSEVDNFIEDFVKKIFSLEFE